MESDDSDSEAEDIEGEDNSGADPSALRSGGIGLFDRDTLGGPGGESAQVASTWSRTALKAWAEFVDRGIDQHKLGINSDEGVRRLEQRRAVSRMCRVL